MQSDLAMEMTFGCCPDSGPPCRRQDLSQRGQSSPALSEQQHMVAEQQDTSACVLPHLDADLRLKAVQAAADLQANGWAVVDGVLPE